MKRFNPTAASIIMIVFVAYNNLKFANSLQVFTSQGPSNQRVKSSASVTKFEVVSLAKEIFASLDKKLDSNDSIPLNDEAIYRHVELSIDKVLEACRAYENQEDVPSDDVSSLRQSVRTIAKDFISTGPFGREIASWPRGPGSSAAMRYVYEGFGALPSLSPKAHYSEWYIRDRDLAHAVRSRKDTLSKLLLDELCTLSHEHENAIDILDLANGPAQSLKDLILSEKIPNSILEKIAYRGYDTDSFNQEQNRIWFNEIQPSGTYHFETKDALVSPFRRNKSKQEEKQQYDIIYSTGFYDYLSDSLLLKIWKRSFQALKPGGVMIISLKDSNMYRSQVYTYLMEWDQFLQRPKEHFENLLMESGMPPPEQEYTDHTGIILFYVIRKPLD